MKQLGAAQAAFCAAPAPQPQLLPSPSVLYDKLSTQARPARAARLRNRPAAPNTAVISASMHHAACSDASLRLACAGDCHLRGRGTQLHARAERGSLRVRSIAAVLAFACRALTALRRSARSALPSPTATQRSTFSRSRPVRPACAHCASRCHAALTRGRFRFRAAQRLASSAPVRASACAPAAARG